MRSAILASFLNNPTPHPHPDPARAGPAGWLDRSLSCAHMLAFSSWVTSFSILSPSHLCHLRKQLQELNGQHQQELSSQLAQFKVEIAEREERQQQVAQDYELRYQTLESPHQALVPSPAALVSSALAQLLSQFPPFLVALPILRVSAFSKA